jgi:uncharacterized protein (TIGR02099 family)
VTLFSRVLRKFWYLGAAIIILAALLVSIMRLLTPVLNDHRADFEKLASDLLKMPVMIREVQVAWHGYSPEIVLYSVTILDPDTQKPKVNLDRLEIDFSIWHTLLDRKIFVRNITLSGMELTITQMAAGEFQIGAVTSLNIKDTLTGSSVHTDEVFAWVFSQPRLAMENINLLYVTPDEDTRAVTLKLLSLSNQGQHHEVSGSAILNQTLPIKVAMHMGWDGDARHMEEAKGHFYIYLEGLSLKQWFSKMRWDGVQIRKGLASIKIWGSWSDKQWQKFQTTFQAYGLEFYSETQKRAEAIDRLRGNIGWKREGNTQVFSGNDIFIDFPYHLWPETTFSVRLTPNASGALDLNALNINYLNLNDALKILSMANTLLADSYRQKILDLAPRGEVQNLHLATTTTLADIQNLVFSGEFIGLTINPLPGVPGLKNFKGKLSWNKNQGNIAVNSSHVFLTLNNLFAQPLYFDQFVANVMLEKNDMGDWTVQAKNINLTNADIFSNTSFVVVFQKEMTPNIDFTAQFKVNDIAHLVNYFPEKILDPDLSKWLQNAFKKGQAMAGTAVLKGKLADFPFDNNNGQFLVTTQLKNMDLNFAPDWPYLTDADGDLTFAGRVITININTGKIAGVPVKKVGANIPYVGDASPQVLHVDGVIQGDLAQGLSFIHQSPLQKTVGKDLAGMNLSGGMDLTLNMVIPLRLPENATVKGDVTMTQASLGLPQWKLSFDKLNGMFQFTDTGIEANNIEGELFGAPATLKLTTVIDDKKKTSQVRADIAGAISIPALESWAGSNMSTMIQGTTNYQAQLLLASHIKGSSSQISITSNLQGVSVNLPEPFAKKAPATGAFQLDLTTTDSDNLKAKFSYNKKITGALNLKTAAQKTQLIGGEVHFGAGSATLQNSPGILITGEMKKLDWDTWQNYFNSLRGTTNSVASKSTALNDLKMLRGVNLSVGTLALMGQQLHEVHFQLSSSAQNWNINLESKELGGQITLPFNMAARPLEAKFQHIDLDTADSKNMKLKLDPRTLPAMNIESEHTRIGDMHIGHLMLNLEPNGSGLLIKQFRINEPTLTLNAGGEWKSSNGRYSSHLEGTMNSPKVSDVLNEWGLNSSNFIASTGEVKFVLDWPDAPYQLTLNGLSGSLSFNLGEGRIAELSDSSNAKIGFGRMLNIFSLSTLPRRLSLNFSDVTQKGFSFDYVKGDFNIKNGSATTDDMKFDGPIARIEIKGRVGLVAKDFNMQISVTPYVTGSLPVVAAFAGGPIVGVAALLVDKVVSQGVSRAITHHYDVTGPWANPVWTSVGTPPSPSAPTPQTAPAQRR